MDMDFVKALVAIINYYFESVVNADAQMVAHLLRGLLSCLEA